MAEVEDEIARHQGRLDAVEDGPYAEAVRSIFESELASSRELRDRLMEKSPALGDRAEATANRSSDREIEGTGHEWMRRREYARVARDPPVSPPGAFNRPKERRGGRPTRSCQLATGVGTTWRLELG